MSENEDQLTLDAAARAASADEAEKATSKPKRATRKTAVKADAEGEAPAAAEAPKRTRAKKSAAADEEDGAADAEGDAPKPKRRTTRKKAADDAAEAAGEETPKPKRATRKTAAKAEEESTDAEADASKPKRATRKTAAKADAEDEAPAAAEAPRRTRAKKSAAADEADGAADAEGDAPKPKRRTTRKKAADDAAEAAGEETPKPKRATRKTAAKKDDAVKDALKAEAADAADGRKSEGETADGGTARESGSAKASEQPGRAEAKKDDQQDEPERSGGHGRRRNRRNRRNGNQRREIVPSATRDELAELDDEELIGKALLLAVDPQEYGERDDLVSAVYDALLQSEGFVMVEGILDLLPDGYGFIRTDGYLPGEHDVYVGMSTVRRNGLRRGDHISGRVRPPRDNEKYPALNTIVALNGEAFEGPTHRVKFAQLTPVYPDERLYLEHGKDSITARTVDLVCPIGKGQRGLIVSPPKAGKTTVLKDIASAISANNPEVHLMCLLVDERPEEVTDMERSIDGEVISSTFDMPADNHIAVAELVIERAKRLVETGQDVVILLDSITRLARAYNMAQPASGRILSGGVDSSALYPPKRFLGAARNIEHGGSLTILGTALIDTGSKMDEVIFEEFKGTGNMELKLDRDLANKRIYPAIDAVQSSTRKDELLIDAQEAPLIWGMRRLLANMNNTERATDMLIKSLKATETNREFLIKSARKASKNSAAV